MCKQVRGKQEALYRSEPDSSCPIKILYTLLFLNAEGRPIWKPMHMQTMTPKHVDYGSILHRNRFEMTMKNEDQQLKAA